ncbi:MAG: WD40/YVTN/BNR-like repeat-containing protein [Candidatus Dormibacteria bacterium]
MARADERGHEGADEVVGATSPEGGSAPPARAPGDDPALHPARHLQARRLGRARVASGVAPLGWPPPGAEAAPGTAGGAPGGGSQPRSRGPAPSAPTGPDGGGQAHPARWSRRSALLGALVLAVAVAAASTAVTLLAQTHPPRMPTAVTIPAVPAAEAIGDLHMVSQSTGWARRVSDGAVLHTTGGMAGWKLAAPLPGRLLAVAYVGPEAALALTVPSGATGQATVQAWITRDGGATWSPGGTLSLEGFNPAIGGALEFADAEHGWFSDIEAAGGLAGTALFRSVDGGASWSRVAATGGGDAGAAGVIPAGCDDLTATFVSATTGFMTGTCLTQPPPLYVSQDGGVSWAAAPLAALPAGITAGTSFPPTFTSGRDGTLLTQDQDGSGGLSTGLFATTDGGLSWRLRSTTGGSPVASDFLDADHGWLVANDDTLAGATELYATRDGGSAWTRLNAFPYSGIGLDFLTPEVGWAAPAFGSSGNGPAYLIRTSDGGRSWSAAVARIAPTPSP